VTAKDELTPRVKPEAKKLINRLHNRGISVHILSDALSYEHVERLVGWLQMREQLDTDAVQGIVVRDSAADAKLIKALSDLMKECQYKKLMIIGSGASEDASYVDEFKTSQDVGALIQTIAKKDAKGVIIEPDSKDPGVAAQELEEFLSKAGTALQEDLERAMGELTPSVLYNIL
jgi:hypothetical protein